MLIAGLDENGLGPLLGPLVTTAVTLEMRRYLPKRHADVGRALGIDDSKSTAGFGHMADAEGLALALVEEQRGRPCEDVDELFVSLLLDPPAVLSGPCPTSSRNQCWSAPLALPCFGGQLEAGRRMLAALAGRGIRIARVRSALACTGTLNARLLAGQSRVEVDLELMERLVLDSRDAAAEDVVAICGMVGGIRNYEAKMRYLSRSRVAKVTAPRGCLAYDVEGVGRVSFEIDADARHLPVALASMVGKYVRELWMARQNLFYRGHDASLDEVSGYHDPVTQRFVQRSLTLRKRLGIVDDCFARKAAKDRGSDRQLSLLE